jgi:uncharacterized protein YdbL (DUF1318 family)
MKRFFAIFMITTLVVFSTGCARGFIENKIKDEAVKKIDAVDPISLGEAIATSIMTFGAIIIRRYIKNKEAQDIVIDIMTANEKKVHELAVKLITEAKEKGKAAVQKLDLSKGDILNQLGEDIKGYFNAIKESETVREAVEEKKIPEEKVKEIIKMKAPAIRPAPATDTPTPGIVSKFRSPETQALIEKLRQKIGNN